MNINNVYKGIKELGEIYQKIDNIEIQKKLLDLSGQALEMQNEILKLQEENIKLRNREDFTSRIERHKDAYITLKEDEQKLIYCSNCWDKEKKLVQVQVDNIGGYNCPACKYSGYYNRQLYKNAQIDNMKNMNTIIV